jgi:hypothetical protein
MYSETGLVATENDVAKAIDNCDVFLIGFRNTTDRLIVDTRVRDGEGPMIEITESTGSIEGRMFWLGQRRPGFGLPEQFKFFVWPNSVDWLVESGTWERIRSRVTGVGYDAEVAAQMDVALDELREIEHETNIAAVRGDGYVSLWPGNGQIPEELE